MLKIKNESKGFIATTILLISIMVVYQTMIMQNILKQRTQETKNIIRLHQRTQENKYRLTRGFEDSIKQSMKETNSKKPIVREQRACEELKNWLDELKEDINVTLKAGYIDKRNYEYEGLITETANAFKIIESKLRKDPSQALGQMRDKATLCINYISIREEGQKAQIRDNSYLTDQITDLIDKEPSYKFHINKDMVNQKIIIPGGTTIKKK